MQGGFKLVGMVVSLEEFKRVRVRSFKELYDLVVRRLKGVTLGRPIPQGLRGDERARRLMLAKLSAACNSVAEELANLERALALIRTAGGFYQEVFKLYTGLDLEEVLEEVRRSRRILRSIEGRYREGIKGARERGELASLFKEGLGRCLSVYKRLGKTVGKVKQGVRELSRMPSVRGDYVAVIAGMPQVGKSTLLSKLTRAKPEIGVFPFTTKTIIVGHWDTGGSVVVLVDTPGILDGPVEEMNEIELKAVYAVKYLADIVIYVFDANPNAYYTIDQQLKTYETVRRLLGEKPIITVLNKVDTLPGGEAEEIAAKLAGLTGVKPIPVSALNGFNLDYLKKAVLEALTAGRRRPSQ
jgi:nucleolar GTP-binding protein